MSGEDDEVREIVASAASRVVVPPGFAETVLLRSLSVPGVPAVRGRPSLRSRGALWVSMACCAAVVAVIAVTVALTSGSHTGGRPIPAGPIGSPALESSTSSGVDSSTATASEPPSTTATASASTTAASSSPADSSAGTSPSSPATSDTGSGEASSPLALTPPPTYPIPPGSLRISLALDTTATTAGQPIKGTATVINSSGHPVPDNCGGWFAIGLQNATYKFTQAVPAPACYPSRTIPTGTSYVPITISTTYQSCTNEPSTLPYSPPCAPGGQIPPLPPGTYQTVAYYYLDRPTPPDIPQPDPIQVTLS